VERSTSAHFTPPWAPQAAAGIWNPMLPILGIGGSGYDVYGPISGPLSFGPGGSGFASKGSGQGFGIGGTTHSVVIDVPQGYVSGQTLAGSSTWDNTTISARGLTPGSYTWTWGTGQQADFLTMNIVVPEPGTLTFLGIGVAGIAGSTWLRRLRTTRFITASQHWPLPMLKK